MILPTKLVRINECYLGIGFRIIEVLKDYAQIEFNDLCEALGNPYTDHVVLALDFLYLLDLVGIDAANRICFKCKEFETPAVEISRYKRIKKINQINERLFELENEKFSIERNITNIDKTLGICLDAKAESVIKLYEEFNCVFGGEIKDRLARVEAFNEALRTDRENRLKLDRAQLTARLIENEIETMQLKRELVILFVNFETKN